MFPNNSWCYDLETLNAILSKGEESLPGVRYCNGWGDFAGMGISVLVAARVDGSEVRVFVGEGIPLPGTEPLYNFSVLVSQAELLIGHNSRSFDAKVLLARGIVIPPHRHLDFYHEAKLALRNNFPRGYSLDAICARTDGPRKSDSGALAPILWQRGEKDRVINYCKNDIQMTRHLALYYQTHNASITSANREPLRLRTPAAIMAEG